MYISILHLYLNHKYQSNQIPYYDCNMNNFGDRVRLRRDQLGMSQDDLGRAAGISQSTVAQIERGRNQGTKHILNLGKALKVRAEWLQTGRGEMLQVADGEENDAASTGVNAGLITELGEPSRHTMGEKKSPAYGNIERIADGRREIPLISYVQASMMTEAVDPFSLGEGFETITVDFPCSEHTFALRIKGRSMLPTFEEDDVIVVDPLEQPDPGSFVIAKNTEEEATFKKYKALGVNEYGDAVFELVPLNDDFATLHSQRDHLRIIGVAVEHRKKLLKQSARK
jgi:SOS-response transcriptional repressor LexA